MRVRSASVTDTKQPRFAMRILREALLSVFVIGVVLYLYLLARSALFLNVCGLASSGGEPEAAHHLKLQQRKLISRQRGQVE